MESTMITCCVAITVMLFMMYLKRTRENNRKRRIMNRKMLLMKLREERRVRTRLQIAQYIKKNPKRIWTIERSRDWWSTVWSGRFGSGWWRDNLRMNRETFVMLVNELRPFIQKSDTHLRLAISTEERVAITVWRLATNAEYRTLSALFGVGLSTVCTIVIETCRAITDNLFPRFVKLPNGNSLREAVDGFNTRWGFPQVVGAIDGSHIPILRPTESATDYYNRKCFHSVIIQGVVDYQGQFIDAYIGWPGKLHDARVFYNSSFYNKGRQGTLLPNESVVIEGTDIPLLILGDPAYPLLPWLMKPYPNTANISESQRHFNYRQSRARMVVENAFGRLKGRWRCLLKRMDCNISNVPYIVAACVTLHNVCERFGDSCLEEWTECTHDIHVDNAQPLPANTVPAHTHFIQQQTQAHTIRQALTTHLQRH